MPRQAATPRYLCFTRLLAQNDSSAEPTKAAYEKIRAGASLVEASAFTSCQLSYGLPFSPFWSARGGGRE